MAFGWLLNRGLWASSRLRVASGRPFRVNLSLIGISGLISYFTVFKLGVCAQR